jgi:hypothetical protein
MLILILVFMGCSSVQGAAPIEVVSDDWHGLEKRIMQLDCDGNLDDDTAALLPKDELPALGSE